MKTTDFAKVLTTFLTVELPSVRNVSPNTVLSYRDTFKLAAHLYGRAERR